jgi:hypothetical protein
MADNANTKDLQQIRNILFGDQALQFEERLENIELTLSVLRQEREQAVAVLRQERDQAVNALRRENRQLRHALEVEAMARTSHDNELQADTTARREAALADLTELLVMHLDRDKSARAEQSQMLHDTLEAYRQSLADMTAQLVTYMQGRQAQTDKQFAAVQAALNGQHQSADGVNRQLADILLAFRDQHVQGDGEAGGDSAETPTESDA